MTLRQEPSASFIQAVQDVLQDFYNPSELQKSQLISLFSLGKEREPAGALRRIFRETIRSLKAEESAPHHSTAWRLYYVLTSRYIEQLSQKEVADELALSTRQIRRYEREAAVLLANALWKQFALEEETEQPAIDGPVAELPVDAAAVTAAQPISVDREQELSWLKSSVPVETTSVTGVISAALRIAAPLIRNQGGNIQYEMSDQLPPVIGQVSSIKQAILELLTAAVSAVPGGTVSINATASQGKVRVGIAASGGQSPQTGDGELQGKLEIARQLASLSGGALELPVPEPNCFAVKLVLSAEEQIRVLAVDDNEDALQLLQRFLAGSRYQVSVEKDPNLVFERIAQSEPEVILLDVMLPGVDGWEVLGQLREHPQTRAVPVIISTILLQENLALSLGAAGFLRKPFTQETLLAVLNQVAG